MAEDQTKQTFRFHHVQGPNFEMRNVDGALVSETFTGKVSLIFFVERDPIERVVEYEVLEDGELGELLHTDVDSGIVFEMHQGMLLSVDQAKALRNRLNEVLESNAS